MVYLSGDKKTWKGLLWVLVLHTVIEFVRANNIYINTLVEVSTYTVSSIPNPHAAEATTAGELEALQLVTLLHHLKVALTSWWPH